MRIKLIFYIFFIGAIGAMGLYGGESFEEFIENKLREDKIRKVRGERVIKEIEILNRLKRIEKMLKAIEEAKVVNRVADERNKTIRGSGGNKKTLGSPVRLEGKGHLSTDLRVIHDGVDWKRRTPLPSF